MKTMLKPIGIAAAVGAAVAGYTNVASAQQVSNNYLGDLAIVPYYTVNGNWITGIHIVNTSPNTQVVKFRFRRAEDSIDALDFNIVMSPYDVYAGFLSDDASGNILWSADDTTCTVPETTNGSFQMPAIYRNNAETGYVEIIAMAQASSEMNDEIAIAAKHTSAGVPLDCDAVRSNFFADGTSTSNPGNVPGGSVTWQADSAVTGGPSGDSQNYNDSGNVLKVSYFLRDNDSGVEFGSNAVHIEDFLGIPVMTNQEKGYLSGDLDGFDFPDLNGGTPASGSTGLFDSILRQSTVLGVSNLINEWSTNPSNGVQTDWVVTFPGQYVMLDRTQYIPTLEDDPTGVYSATAVCANGTGALTECDFRDIPVVAAVAPWNREERAPGGPTGTLVVSPSVPGAVPQTILPNEVNVVTFGSGSVLGVEDANITAELGQPYGWLSLGIAATSSKTKATCAWDPEAGGETSISDLSQTCTSVVNTTPPLVGFTAWVRNVAANPDASYGRIIEHSSN